MKSSEEIINEYDKNRRLEDETIILKKAESLTNGHSDDPKTTAEVLQWQVKEQIAQGLLLRTVVIEMKSFQKKSDCAILHKPKTWKVKLFGIVYNAPAGIAFIVIGWLVFMYGRKNGFM
jgi:ferritin